jgi:hypothetical protein
MKNKQHIEQLNAALMNEGAYRAALCALKASKPRRDDLVAIYEAVKEMRAGSGATKTELYRGLERHAASERRYKARAEVSRNNIPL